MERTTKQLLERWEKNPGLRGIFARAWRAWHTAIARNRWIR